VTRNPCQISILIGGCVMYDCRFERNNLPLYKIKPVCRLGFLLFLSVSHEHQLRATLVLSSLWRHSPS
jgi:hypothetical protein